MMKSRWTRFWYKFKNWFRTKPGPGEPLLFVCGSEEELRRVTIWMCHANEKVFLERTRITIYFSASTPYYRGRTSLNRMAGGDTCLPREPWPSEWKYILRWSKIILDFNQFTGTHWDHESEADGLFPEITGGLPRRGLPPFFGVCKIPLLLDMTVSPPSAHERAESLLSLSEWLDGKVSEEEKRELLQLPEADGHKLSF